MVRHVGMDLDEQLHQMQAEYTRTRETVVGNVTAMQELSATARDVDRIVEVTLDASGRPTTIELLGEKWRKQKRTVLEAALVSAFAAANAELAQARLELLPSSPFPGVSAADLMSGKVDWAALLPASLDLPEPGSLAPPPTDWGMPWVAETRPDAARPGGARPRGGTARRTGR